MKCKIYLVSLTEYNKGMIDGKWIDLTDNNNARDEIEAFMDAREGEEFFIADNVASVPMEISEYENIFELVDFVKRLEELDETQVEAYEAIVSELGWDREEALDTAESWEFDAIDWNDESLETAVGYYYAEISGYTADNTIRSYFDYEKYGRDICIESDVCDNGKTIFIIY